MAVLGAQTDELIELASQLERTGGDIAAVQSETQATAAHTIDQIEATFARALTETTTAMATLRHAVDAASARLAGTTWTGSNRGAFESAYTDFNGAMGSLEGAVQDAYGQFDAQMKQVSALIGEFQAQASASMEQAHASTTSMQHAVVQQRENLESAMNGSLSFAG